MPIFGDSLAQLDYGGEKVTDGPNRKWRQSTSYPEPGPDNS